MRRPRCVLRSCPALAAGSARPTAPSVSSSHMADVHAILEQSCHLFDMLPDVMCHGTKVLWKQRILRQQLGIAHAECEGSIDEAIQTSEHLVSRQWRVNRVGDLHQQGLIDRRAARHDSPSYPYTGLQRHTAGGPAAWAGPAWGLPGVHDPGVERPHAAAA